MCYYTANLNKTFTEANKMKMYSMLCMMCICEYTSFAVPSDSSEKF